MNRCPPPLAWSIFARNYPNEAIVRSGIVGSRFDLERVNTRVNRIAVQSGPMDMSEGVEQWLIWPSRAWCHDYAATKRHELLGMGWPSSSLLLAQCRTSQGEGHMVLIVDGLCLDNRHAQILPFDATGYDWSLPMQSADDPNVWVKN